MKNYLEQRIKIVILNSFINKKLKILYKNWKGVVSFRNIEIKSIWKGETEYHKGEQYFVTALDLDKNKTRDFAINDIISIPLGEDMPILNKYKVGLKGGDLITVKAERSISDSTWTHFYNGENRHEEKNFVAAFRSSEILYITKESK
ncbi:hypothetical protein [Proteus phage J3S]